MPRFQPFWRKTKTNRDLLAHVFPRLTHWLLDILPKNAFWSESSHFRSLSSQKESKLSKTLFTSRVLDSFQSSGMRRKQNFVFYLLLSPLPASFAFLSPFFSFVGHLLGFLLVGKDFAKRSRIVNFFWRKYQWVVGQDFHWNFLVKVTRFFASFSGLFDWIAFIWVWLERSHLPAQGSCQIV